LEPLLFQPLFSLNTSKEEKECIISLSDWFDDMPVEVKATESVIDLGYNGRFLTLLIPHIPDLDEFMAENEY